MSQLTLMVTNKNIAFKVFMPFVEDGAVFIPSDEKHRIGDKVTLKINMPELQKEMDCEGVVIWISPLGSHSKRGVGVQFQGKQGEQVKQAFEAYVAGMKMGNNKTFTL